ncbi:MAG: GGDEF domain-containing protein [Ruminococcus sp.]|nr:GGDEF domain-containing protein [Ruminococcus sp.]
MMLKKREPLTFVNLALALANDYSRLFVIDAENDSYVEYSPDGEEKELVAVAGGDDFFTDVRRDVRAQVWEEDQEYFLNAFKKEAVVSALNDGMSFSLTYRLNFNGVPRYFYLKTIRATDRSIVIGVQDVDEQKRRELKAEEASRTYSEIAGSLASLFEVIYHIDIATGHYTEYSSSESYAKLGLQVGGEDFFTKARQDINLVIHPDDRELVIGQLDRDVLLKQLRNKGSVQITYRQILDDRIQYVELLAFFKQGDTESLVIGVRNVDAQTRREKSMEQQTQTFSNMAMALALQYEVIYHVDLNTNEYSEYSASDKYARLDIGTVGKDFFADTVVNMKKDIYPADLPMMLDAMKKENLLKSIAGSGKVFLNYRLMIDGEPQYVSLYAVQPNNDKDHLILAVANVDAAKKMELEYRSAVDMANRDALTAVKNKRAYAQAEMELDEKITNDEITDFAIVICDINGLKNVNDTKGHNAGDEFIKSGCKDICDVFEHSPVFRIGGDEFAVIVKDRDFADRERLMEEFLKIQEQHRRTGLVTIACGISEFDKDKDIRVQDVFERADSLMYHNKKEFKSKNA